MEDKTMKKGVGKLTIILISVVIFSLAYASMWAFYADIIGDYSGHLDFTTDDDFNKTYDISIGLLNESEDDMIATQQKYLNSTGTRVTGEDSMILNSYKTVKRILIDSFKLIWIVIPDTATRLHINKIWVRGALTIFFIVTIILIISGFLKVTHW